VVTVPRETRGRHRALGATDPGSNSDAGGVVVGVDGSENSKAALSWAAEEARLRRLPLDVIMTWQQPIDPDLDWPSSAQLKSDTRRALDKIIRSVLGDQGRLEVRSTTVSGQAGHVLRDRSEHATLLVVGSRGREEVAGLLLGSVSEFLATHARCPVLIVRGTPDHVEIPTPSPTTSTSRQPSPAAKSARRWTRWCRSQAQ
jgi:nucleotide-binding universal stress UspA family protein